MKSSKKVQNTTNAQQAVDQVKTRKQKAPKVTLAVNRTQSLRLLHESGKAFTSDDFGVLSEKIREFACKRHCDTIHFLIGDKDAGVVRWSRTKIQSGFEARFAADVRTKNVKLTESVLTLSSILEDNECSAREQAYDEKGQFVLTAECGNGATAERVFGETAVFLLGLAMFDDRATRAAAM